MSELYTPPPDYFELEQPMQPKRTVGDYVESQGILVPRRFDDFEEAQFAAKAGTPVIARSEHPDDYNGPSGLGYSSYFHVNRDDIMLPMHYNVRDTANRYQKYAVAIGNEEPEHYTSMLSESYWEGIPGINVTCIADDAIEGRYHIFGYGSNKHDSASQEICVGAIAEEDGTVVRLNQGDKATENFTVHFKEIIDFYNQVRRLDHFNPEHCPIIEMQLSSVDDNLYFLQYHRSRDAAPVTERLNASEYDQREGWVKADSVRGAHLGNRALQLALCYRGLRNRDISTLGMHFPDDGSTSIDSVFWVIDEAIVRQSTARLMPRNFGKQYSTIAGNHGPRSQMIKPQVSMLTNPSTQNEFISEDLISEAYRLAMHENKEVRIETDVVSDGRDGYFRYNNQLTVTD